MKKISFLLVITVLMMSIVIPMSASAATVVDFSENFNNYADDAAVQVNWVPNAANMGTAVIGTGEDNSKAITVAHSGSAEFIKGGISPTITADKTIKVNFKFKNDYTGYSQASEYQSTIISLAQHTGSVNYYTPVIYVNQGQIYTGTTNANASALKDSNENIAQSVSGKWYDAEVIYDLEQKTYTVSVTDENNNVYTGSYAGHGSITYINQFRLQSWSGTAGTGSMTIDDITIDDYDPTADDGDDDEEEETSTALLEDNFNGKDVAAIVEKWTLQGGTSQSIVSVGTGADETAALEMLCSTGTNYLAANFKEAVEAGEIVASFKMMHDYTDSTGGTTAMQTSIISLADMLSGGNYIPVLYIKNGKMYTGTNNDYDSSKYICDSVSGVWYDVEVVFNVTDMTYDIYVTNGSQVQGKSNVLVSGFGNAVNMTSVNAIRLQMWDAKENGQYGKMTIDDVLVNYSTDAVDVKQTDLTFENAKGETSYYAATIPASTAKINIDFGTMMDPASLTTSSVVLTNVTDNAPVTYTAEPITGTVYTLNLPNLLVPGKDYSLTITTDVKNANLEPAANEAVFNFKADSGECEVSFNAFAIGANNEPTVADIVAASSATVKMNVLNSTGIDKDLLIIVAYYKGNELLDVVYAEDDMPYATYKNGVFEKVITLKTGDTIAEADKVSIFAWDTIATMKPYTTNIVLPAQQ